MPKKVKNILMHLVSGMILLAIFVVPFLAQAGGTGSGCGEGQLICNPFKQDSIKGLIEVIVKDIFIPIGGVIAVVMIIYAGFLYVTARGNTAKIGEAHKALLYAVIGAAILLGAWVISEAISATIDTLKKGS